jgi:hypothetical protein
MRLLDTRWYRNLNTTDRASLMVRARAQDVEVDPGQAAQAVRVHRLVLGLPIPVAPARAIIAPVRDQVFSDHSSACLGAPIIKDLLVTTATTIVRLGRRHLTADKVALGTGTSTWTECFPCAWISDGDFVPLITCVLDGSPHCCCST